MITNILASIVITLVTNVTTTDNAVYEQTPNPCPDRKSFGPGVSCLVFHGYSNGAKIKDATEKTETTTIKEVSTIEFVWNGEKKSVPNGERVISTKSETFRKVEAWGRIDSPDKPIQQAFFTTNAARIIAIISTNTFSISLANITNQIK